MIFQGKILSADLLWIEVVKLRQVRLSKANFNPQTTISKSFRNIFTEINQRMRSHYENCSELRVLKYLSQLSFYQTLFVYGERLSSIFQQPIQTIKNRRIAEVSILKNCPMSVLNCLNQYRVNPFKLTGWAFK